MSLRERLLAKKAERNELRQELTELKASSQGDIIAISEVIDGFTDLEDMKLDIAKAQLKELEAKQLRAREIRRMLKDIDHLLKGIE